MLITYDNIRERYDMLTPNDPVLVNETLLWMLLKQKVYNGSDWVDNAFGILLLL